VLSGAREAPTPGASRGTTAAIGLDLQGDFKVYRPLMSIDRSDLRISEVTARTGFSGPTLRYYEDIGLLPAPARTGAGYRSYSQRDVDRLTFIARAKRLGCSLDEIRVLAEAWDQDRCGPVQHQLRSLVGAKVVESQTQMVELMEFIAALRAAAAQLAEQPVEGACDDSCACLAPPQQASGEPVGVALGRPVDGSTPIACTLGAGDMSERLGDWEAALATVVARTPLEGGVRLVFGPDAPIRDLARLVVAEQACCTFFAFAITVDQRGVALEVTSPPDGAEILDSAFGTAT
jgi:MerR family copper efflux transcriptional regulator